MMRLIRGSVPRELRGVYYKNGPFITAKDITSKHYSPDILDRDGYIQRIEFRDGVATYSSRIVDVTKGPNSHIRAFSGPYVPLLPFGGALHNPGNTNITYMPTTPQKLLALYDGGSPYIIDPLTLETRGTHRTHPFNGLINSHPHNGVFMSLDYDVYSRTKLRFIDSKSCVDCQYAHFLYAHDFLISDKYYIVFDHALCVDMSPSLDGIGKRLRSTGGMQKIVLINRITGELVAAIPFVHPDCGFTTHHVSLHEDVEKRQLHVATICYPAFLATPGKIVTITICTRTMQITNINEVRQWAEFPAVEKQSKDVYLTTFTGIGRYHPRTGRFIELRIHERDDYLYSEVCIDEKTGYALCYVWNDTKKATMLQILNLTSTLNHVDLVAELAFPGSQTPSIGLHGFFTPN